MAKRTKRLKKGIESLKEEIEEHFIKLEEDIAELNFERGRYHARELDKSLIKALEERIEFLSILDDSAKIFRMKLEELRKKLED